MSVELFKTILAEFRDEDLLSGIPRETKVILNARQIVSIVGGRRTGKTTLLKQAIQQLTTKGIAISQIIYVNFEDERIPRDAAVFQDLLDAQSELVQEIPLKECWFFFDEIHEIPGWYHFLNRMQEMLKGHLFITGSSAKLLSKEIASSLRGRTITLELFPFSFREYLQYKDIDAPDAHTTRGQSLLRTELRKYMEEGGYPATIGQSKELRSRIHRSYLDVMIYRDLIERYQISNHNALRQYIKKMLANAAKESSVNKTYLELKSQGHKISKDQLYNFRMWCEEIYLLFQLPQYHESFVKQQSGIKKTFGLDTGLINSTSFRASQDHGRLMENMVFTELKRKEKEIFFNKEGKECDFLVKENDQINQAIQVTVNLEDQATRNREVAGLLYALEKYNLKKGLLITMNEDEVLSSGKKTIRILPLWRWLIE